MATLNLVPNPVVLVVQAGVFGVAYGVIKKLYVEPYLKLRDKREALTVGSKDDATNALNECDRLANEISARLNAAATEAKKMREAVRDAAIAKRNTALNAATAEAKSFVDGVEKQIKQDLAAERAKVPEVTRTLTEEIYKLALA